ncbi:glycosyltransferase, partial [uncultured Duncaniella sp.]
EQYGLTTNNYSLAICRIEPENNVHTILEAYSRTPDRNLVFVGNWHKSAYGLEMQKKYDRFHNIKILKAIYDLKALNVLRSNCRCYIHGHSAGGTNPSLVEAMFFRKPIIAFDCIYNRESTEDKAEYFSNSDDLISRITNDSIDYSANAEAMIEIANRRYTWSEISKQYCELY